MKKIINNIYLMCSIMLLIMLGACSDEDKFMGDNDEIVVTATMPDDGTSSNHGTLKGVAVSSDDNTLNLITKWKSGDKIQVFVRQDNKVYKVSEESAVYNISSDGKTCSFNFSLPSSIDGARVYDVIGVTGISAQASGSEVYATSTLKRMNLDSNGEATSPMWFITAKTNTATNFQAKFQHLGTYEILHVTNATSGDLTFRHLGFDVSEPWFKYNDNTVLNNTYDPTAHFTEPGDAESPTILIKSGKTGKILSWYIPSGLLMEGAKLLALINGKNVTSSNTKSSALPIQRGKAYHMYATWDGKQLKFDDNSHGSAEHEYVDLGLPSGTLWATMNVGANSPEEYGDYFAWGETEEKDEYNWSTYKWCNGDYNKLTKYCNNSSYGNNGFTDGKTELDPEDDAATANWGPEWRMPSQEQMQELIDNVTWQWTTVNGVNGQMITSNVNGASLFLPASGICYDNVLDDVNTVSSYLSRNLYTIFPNHHYFLYISPWHGIITETGYCSRSTGQSVRAVYVSQD